MNQLKEIHKNEVKKFWSFVLGALMKIAAYYLLFSIDWRIAVGIMLIERSSTLMWSNE